jgi:hypothetical protein
MVTIKNFSNYRIDIKGNVYVLKNNILKQLKPSLINPGYYTVVLTNEVGRKKFYIHRLLATYFIPNPKNLETVNHINGIKTDNSISNLEWLSKADNNKHAFANGLQAKRENRTCTKISNAQMIALHNDGHSGNFSAVELANKYKLTAGYIRELSRGLYNKELKLIPFGYALKKAKTII